MDTETFLKKFPAQLRDGSAAVLCGAGVSKPSSLPDWAELLEPARAELSLGSDFEDLALLATYYVTNVDGGRTRLTNLIRERLTEPSIVPNDIHHALWNLPVRYLWSLNFDNLLEAAYLQMTGHSARVIQSDDRMNGSLSRPDKAALVKVHGGVDQLDNAGGRSIVVTRDDFDSYLQNYPRTWSRLLSDFYTKSMLFVGISFADPNMQTLLRLVRQADQKITQQHYAIMRAPSPSASPAAQALHDLQAADLRRGGVEPVEIDSYAELPDLLRQAAVLARPPVVMVSGSLSGDAERQFLHCFGVLLASNGLAMVHGGSRSLETLPSSYAEHLVRIGEYDDKKLVQVRRSEAVTPDRVDERRVGTIVFPGVDTAAVRTDLCARAAICVVIGGSTHTREEVVESERQGLRVVPVPVSDVRTSTDKPFSLELWEAAAGRTARDPLDLAIANLNISDPMAKAERLVAAIKQHLVLESR